MQPHSGRNLRHALERGHRRTIVLQEFPGIYQLQDGSRDARGLGACHRTHAAALRDLFRADQTPAAMAGKKNDVNARPLPDGRGSESGSEPRP